MEGPDGKPVRKRIQTRVVVGTKKKDPSGLTDLKWDRI